MSSFLAGLIDLVFPPRCLVCGKKSEETFCPDCQEKIKKISPPFCVSCGKKAEGVIVMPSLCGQCRVRPPCFSSARAIGGYEGTLREAIHKFKYQGKKRLAIDLGKLMVEYLRKEKEDFPQTPIKEHQFPPYQEIDCLVPVPLHPSRLRERGFNQSELLAEVIRKDLGIPLLNDTLLRIKATQSQTKLSREERIKNVKGAFAIIDADSFSNKTILLIDDMFTTGETINECAKALKEAKVKKIAVLTLART
ncbi:MAG: ComF family protein [Armatimonadetes bacterium CG07_land_8_20_14_0_80_40_9]|nr:MAG: ComF family protein [Armatimonadetes bacterium CG07_land_8_20_14_0_80_40_9]